MIYEVESIATAISIKNSEKLRIRLEVNVQIEMKQVSVF